MFNIVDDKWNGDKQRHEPGGHGHAARIATLPYSEELWHKTYRGEKHRNVYDIIEACRFGAWLFEAFCMMRKDDHWY